MALARIGPLHSSAFETAWPDQIQLQRALDGLLEDGLLIKAGPGRYALP